MQVLKTRDVEDAIRQDLDALLGARFSYTVIAPPLPKNLGHDLPLIAVYRLGGSRDDLVVEEHDLSIDVYEERWSQAHDVANTALAALVSLEDMDEIASGVDWQQIRVNALPYNNPDPYHQDIPRVTFSVMATCRPEPIEL